LPSDGSISSLAVLLAATINAEEDEVLDTTSIVINSNEFRNRRPSGLDNPFIIPTALLSSKAAAVVQGNLIQNFGQPGEGAIYSLLIGGSELAVTGNVFLGRSVIPPRDDITSFGPGGVFEQLNSWRFFNYHKSDQSQ
jgi:hypothetical protein